MVLKNIRKECVCSRCKNENGNVLTCSDKSFIWSTGRNLESIVDGENEFSYTYDEWGKSLRNYIIAKATIIAGRFGALINPAVAACSAALALVISGFSATTVARALIEGKGISITWSRTKKVEYME